MKNDLRRDSSGLAAVEFALILPIMLLLFLGSFETTNLVLAYMKTGIVGRDHCRSGRPDQSEYCASERRLY